MAEFTNTILAALLLNTVNSTEIIQTNSYSELETKIAQTEIDKNKLEEVMRIKKETQTYLTKYLPNLVGGIILTGGYCEVPEPKIPAPPILISEHGLESFELPYFFDNGKLSIISLRTIEKEISKCAKEEFAELRKLPEGHDAELPDGLKYGIVAMQTEVKAESVDVMIYQMINLARNAPPGKREFYTFNYKLVIPSRITALIGAAREYLNERAFAFPDKAREISEKYDIKFRLVPLEAIDYNDSKIIGVIDNKSSLKFLFAGKGMGDGI